ncbi:MAG TPA: hypothetical protein VLB67_01105 [Acidimicrobiia bacterium]|nr:hypothetical protein [Acidimicrobiia bacterium]
MRERGSASLVAAVITGIVLVAGMTVMTIAGIVSAGLHARAAADAAALAAVSPVVTDHVAAARGVAALNRATLVECRCPATGSSPPFVAHVRVETRVRLPLFGSLTLPAEASAEYSPAAW